MSRSFSQLSNTSKQNDKAQLGFSIFIVPLPPDIKDKDLKFLFSLCGPIKNTKIIYQPSKGHCFGFVNFQSMESRQKAKKYYHGKMLGLKVLTVVDNRFRKLQLKRNSYHQQDQTEYEDGQISEFPPKKKLNFNQNPKQEFKKSINNKDKNTFSKFDSSKLDSPDLFSKSKDKQTFTAPISNKINGRDQEKYRESCSEPYSLKISGKNLQSHKESSKVFLQKSKGKDQEKDVLIEKKKSYSLSNQIDY